MQNSWRDYLPPVSVILISWVLFEWPLLASVILGGGLLFVGLAYLLMVHRWHQFLKNGTQRTYGFEEEIYSKGGPGLRNISVSVFRRYSDQDNS